MISVVPLQKSSLVTVQIWETLLCYPRKGEIFALRVDSPRSVSSWPIVNIVNFISVGVEFKGGHVFRNKNIQLITGILQRYGAPAL